MIRKDWRTDLLIKLLNKYEKERKDRDWQFRRTYKYRYWLWWTHYYFDSWWDTDEEKNAREIISKSYGFIKRLWDNEYINYTDVIRKKEYRSLENEMISIDEERYCEVLMLLSISEEPIKLLIYILDNYIKVDE